MMRNLFLFLLGAALFTPCGASKKAVYKGVWQRSPIVADGQNSDWPALYAYTDDKAKIQYCYSNDSKNLYFTLKTSDPQTQMKILHGGMQLWLDGKGGREQTTCIRFPVPGDRQAEILQHRRPQNNHMQEDAPERQQGDRGGERLRVAIGWMNEASVQGFQGCSGAFLLSKGNACGLQLKLGVNELHELIYEAVIPISSFYKTESAGTRKPIGIGIEINGLEMPVVQRAGQGGEGMHRGGGMQGGGGMRGGMGGGSMHGGGGRMGGAGGRSSEDREELAHTTRTWFKMQLAYQ